ncbi:mucin-2-like [Macrobrachium nipponense]|uniref:mucin-2-like n=1 Tax=Macrobrachium nipponense TaxID=159736 RepID=UPI0030C83F6E
MMHQNLAAAAVHPSGSPPGGPHLHQAMHRQLRRLAYFMFLLFLFSLTSSDNAVSAQRKEGLNYTLLGTIPQTTFSCRGHTAGYYADPETGCQVYHMCDTLEKQYSYLCPNYTLFNQKFMVCDHWYMVNCSSATDFYDLNDHIGEVSSSRENGGEDANNIKVIGARKITPSSRETSSKEAKFSPVAVTFKAPGSPSSPQIPTNSLVTEEPTVPAPKGSSSLRPFSPSQTSDASGQQTSKTTPRPLTTRRTPQTTRAGVQQFITSTAKPITTPKFTQTSRTSFLQTLKPTVATTPRPTFSQTLSTSVQQSTKSTVRPVEGTPSRFFELPNVESLFHSIPDSLIKPSPPPSVFLQPPQQHGESSLVSADAKLGAGNDTISHHGHFPVDHVIPFVQTPRPGTPFTMVPGIVARGTGNKFTFSSTQEKPFNAIDFNSIIFRPLVLRPKDKKRKIFTTAPASIALDPHHHDASGSDQVTQHSTTTVFAAPLSANSSASSERSNNASIPAGIRVPSILLQPPPLVTVSANVPPFLPAIQQTLIPPVRIKQEFPTPLVTPVRSILRPLLSIIPSSRFQFPVSRSNRDFFIPSPGLSLPKEEGEEEESTNPIKGTTAELQNALNESAKPKKTNMTMVFPEPRNVRLTTLEINPECPKCHPAFLRPGECTPCVLIR